MALERLLSALENVDRLILLGDVVELLERRPASAMQAAEPVLREIGATLRGREICIVPGNHDLPLVQDWARRRGPDLGPATPVPRSASALLERLTGWLDPAEVSVSYPGLWISPRVWVTHGHHINRHLLPTNAIGVRREWLGRASLVTAPADYERRGHDGRPAKMVKAPVALMRRFIDPQIAPLTAWLLGQQMRRAALPAMRRVVRGFGLEPEFVVFGHVHRLGPLPDEDPGQWAGIDGAPALLNTGSWLYEPLLVRHTGPPHPYWPGGAVLLEDDGEPRAVGLLDSLEGIDLSRPAPEQMSPRRDR